MKVLEINAVNGIKSTGRTTLEIANYINNVGHEGYIAYSDGLKFDKGFKIGSKFEIKLHGLLSRIFGTQAYFSKSGTKKLLRYIHILKPDVIHLHNLHGNFINLKLLLQYISKEDIATVITLHDCWFYTGKCTHYTLDSCFKWTTKCKKCPRLKKDNISWFFDRTTKMYIDKKLFNNIPRLAVVGVSDWITNEARKSFLSSANIITRIYNWIDLDVFKKVNSSDLIKKLNLNNKFVILGVASNWNNEKGLDKFIQLADIIPIDMTILLIGNLAHNVSLSKNIIHIKETHNIGELVKYYSLANVFLNLSLEESFGKVTAEALAIGLPVITNNYTANPELVNEQSGIVLEEVNIHNILSAISIIKNNNSERYSKHSRTRAESMFNYEKRAEDYLNVYYSITDRGDKL